MRVRDILNRFPSHKQIGSIYKFQKPGLYLIKFKSDCAYIGQSSNVCIRLKRTLEISPIMRFLRIDPRDFPVYFLKGVGDSKKRKKLEKDLVKEFDSILLNIEYSEERSPVHKVDRTRKIAA